MPFFGNAADAIFTLLFTAKAGPSGFTSRPAAYLFANRPKASSYVPVATYRSNSAGKSMTVLRGGVGKYTVVLKGMPARGAVIVTPAGNTAAHCQLSSLGSVVPMKAIVRCFTMDGTPTDSKFSLTYTS